MSKQIYVPILLKLFRQFGYEGVTLARISQATGLGKASLYHHFPGGKSEMAAVALLEVDRWLATEIVPILARPAQPIEIFESMCAAVDRFFNNGQNSCLWAVLILAQSSDDLFHPQIEAALSEWIDAIANVLIAAGLDRTMARQRGEDAIIAIQGGLILARGLRDFTSFERVIHQLPAQLCRDL